jgi:hypothetical protein
MPLACIFVALNAIQIIYLSDSQDDVDSQHLPHLCVPVWEKEIPYPVLLPHEGDSPLHGGLVHRIADFRHGEA